MNTLALDIGGTAIKAALVTGDGQLLCKKETASNGKLGGERLIQAAFEAADSYSDYDCIGISTTGQVDSKTGTIVFANENVPHYTGMQVGQRFAERYGKPVAVENDVNAAAVGEAYYGAGRNCKDFLCLTYGTGVGGSLFLNGALYTGANGVAGEMGHIITHPQGRACACGQQGCYEQYASTTALVREAMEQNPMWNNGRIVFEQLQNDEKRIKIVIDQWIDEIILGLCSCIHSFNPARLILGGGIMNERYILDRINQLIYHRIMPSYRSVEIVQAQLGNHAGILGASVLASRIGEM